MLLMHDENGYYGVLSDFGKAVQQEWAITNCIQNRSTKAPEVDGKTWYNNSADVWSCGLELARVLIALTRPKPRSSEIPAHAYTFEQVSAELESYRRTGGRIYQELSNIFLAMIKTNYQDRPSMKQVVACWPDKGNLTPEDLKLPNINPSRASTKAPAMGPIIGKVAKPPPVEARANTPALSPAPAITARQTFALDTAQAIALTRARTPGVAPKLITNADLAQIGAMAPPPAVLRPPNAQSGADVSFIGRQPLFDENFQAYLNQAHAIQAFGREQIAHIENKITQEGPKFTPMNEPAEFAHWSDVNHYPGLDLLPSYEFYDKFEENRGEEGEDMIDELAQDAAKRANTGAGKRAWNDRNTETQDLDNPVKKVA